MRTIPIKSLSINWGWMVFAGNLVDWKVFYIGSTFYYNTNFLLSKYISNAKNKMQLLCHFRIFHDTYCVRTRMIPNEIRWTSKLLAISIARIKNIYQKPRRDFRHFRQSCLERAFDLIMLLYTSAALRMCMFVGYCDMHCLWIFSSFLPLTLGVNESLASLKLNNSALGLHG